MSSDIEEYKALTSTLSSFLGFGRYQYERLIKPRKIKEKSLSDEDSKLIPWYSKYIEELEMCVNINDSFTRNICDLVAGSWGAPSDSAMWQECTELDYDKVRSILLQVSREWSREGEVERDVAFSRIMKEVFRLHPGNRANVKVLVPGCGLGRLVFEFVRNGFWCQGNEFSYHMLLMSNFILNHSAFANSFSFFPFLHKSSHVVKRLNQMRPVTVPDVNPLEIHELARQNPSIPYEDLMSMTAGSFLDLYGPDFVADNPDDPTSKEFRASNERSFDIVVTSFFLDTAHNIISYIRAIFYCLKPGAHWINFGPLLWHFEDDSSTHLVYKRIDNEGNLKPVNSILQGLELSRDDLIALIEEIGFIFEKRESNIKSTYSGDPKSLGNFVYDCEFWVCRKPEADEDTPCSTS